MNPVKAFISFSSKDETYKEEFKTYLSPLVRQKKLILWDSTRLHAGLQWDKKIRQQIEEAHIIFFLVSPSSLASDYINDVEISRAMDRCTQGNAILVPVILRPCDWMEHMGLADHYLAVPMYGKPISTWENTDLAYVDVVRQIKYLLKSDEVNVLLTQGSFKDTSTTKSDTVVTNSGVDSPNGNGQNKSAMSIEAYKKELKTLISQNKLKEVMVSLQGRLKDDTASFIYLGELKPLKEKLDFGVIDESNPKYLGLKFRILNYVKSLEFDDLK